jgi:hypothetical protein
MKKFLFGSFCLFLLTACGGDDDQPVIPQQSQLQKGTLAYLRDYMGELAYSHVVGHDFPIIVGQHPPIINDSYEVTGAKIYQTNVSGETTGASSGTINMIFQNQNNTSLTLDYQSKHHITIGNAHTETNSESGYPVISGEGDNFTVVAKVDALTGIDKRARTIHIISGTMSETGIKNFRMLVVMISNNGNSTYYFENKKSRVYTDTDGTVEIWE